MKLRNRLKNSLPGFTAVTILLFMGNLQSDSYRCGSKLVRSGDTSGRLMKICGAPQYKDRGRETIKVDGLRKEVPVERWYYQKSKQSLERIVLLHRGKVVAIETGGR